MYHWQAHHTLTESTTRNHTHTRLLELHNVFHKDDIHVIWVSDSRVVEHRWMQTKKMWRNLPEKVKLNRNKALMKKERKARMKQTQMVSARESSYLWYVKGMDVHKSTSMRPALVMKSKMTNNWNQIYSNY